MQFACKILEYARYWLLRTESDRQCHSQQIDKCELQVLLSHVTLYETQSDVQAVNCNRSCKHNSNTKSFAKN